MHVPGTKLSNGYGKTDDWDRFCETLERSDVAVVGITDYFSVDRFFLFKEAYELRYPDTTKVFFPNIELRLNEIVNGTNQVVDVHLLLRPDVAILEARTLLAGLNTEMTDSNGRQIPCSELTSKDQFNRATVSRASLDTARKLAYGTQSVWNDKLIVLVPASNNGIRAQSSVQRKCAIADEIDKMANAIFGSIDNVEHFLSESRYEDGTQTSRPKPVFSGSDAHNFEDLESWLGKDVKSSVNRKSVTWVKADPTFEGLLQTLAEPRDRVRIQSTRPDRKMPYHYISSVRFNGTPDFPSRIIINQNLCSIIGSRSSGKSALLAHIAHAVDPEYTVSQQVATGVVRSRAEAGPAAGYSWTDVSEVECLVEWGDPASTRGQVIYIPQNSLFSISERPIEITEKIKPAVYRRFPSFEPTHKHVTIEIDSLNQTIRDSVARWFALGIELASQRKALGALGEKEVLTLGRDKLAAELLVLQSGTEAANSVAAYQRVAESLGRMVAVRTELQEQQATMAEYLRPNRMEASDQLRFDLKMTPPPDALPPALRESVVNALEAAARSLQAAIGNLFVLHQNALRESERVLDAEISEIETKHHALIEAQSANAVVEECVADLARHDAVLRKIVGIESEIERLTNERTFEIGTVDRSPTSRLGVILKVIQDFEGLDPRLDDLHVGLEAELDANKVDAISEDFNRRDRGVFIDHATGLVQLDMIRRNPSAFLCSLETGAQRLKQGKGVPEVGVVALTLSEDIRFFAELDGDRIGGFAKSSMTPGKQALFALTLILAESDEPWPLLIDQPEDDLDSRSVYDQIVPYLTSRKCHRQIIMVTHNANLVVGGDSEQVIVANRHGADRKNRGNQTFDYISGSLEHSSANDDSDFVLGSCGIREHACGLLDGGVEAFAKRKEKYHI